MNPPILALILAGARSDRLHALGRHRTAAALPYGGKYRVIDFTLSNCVHSGFYRVGVLTQYAPLSLHGHIGIGRAWDLDRRDGGIRLLPAYVRQRETNWYRGTADAIVQNRNVIGDAQARHLLVLFGDMVTKIDFGRLVERHEARGAALTVVTASAPRDGAGERPQRVAADAAGRVAAIDDASPDAREGVFAASIYVFRSRDLMPRLADPAIGPDLVADVIRPMIAEGLPVWADHHDGYWRRIGTIDAYYEASMELLQPFPALNLHDPDWPIYTPSEDRAPAIVLGQGDSSSSLVAHGSRVEGVVRRSILFPGVHVSAGAVVEDSIVMHDARVLPGARLSRAIVDKEARVGEESVVGMVAGADGSAGGASARPWTRGAGRNGLPPNREAPEDLASGLTVIGKGAELPARCRIEPNTLIETGTREGDFPGAHVSAGSVVRPKRAGRG